MLNLLNPYRFGEGGGGPAFPVVESITPTSFPVAGQTHNVLMPPVVNAGELLLNFMTSHYTSATSTTQGTMNTPLGWTQVAQFETSVSSDFVTGVACFAREADGAEDGSSVNFSTSGSSPNATAAAQCYRVTGWTGVLSDIEAGGAAASASSSPNPLNFSPSWGSARALWIPVAGHVQSDASVSSYPSNYVNGINTVAGAASSSAAIATARRELEAASENVGAFSLSTAQIWVSFAVAILAAA